MDAKKVIASASRNRHTIVLTAQERDGCIETREAEPYSYRFEKRREYFHCYGVRKQGTHRFLVSSIIAVEETDSTSVPRWPIEV